jgi:Uncharacterised nucleotidyltransferase
LTPPGPIGSFWPTEQQTLLLRAALCDGEQSVAAWSRLRPELDLDTLEPESTVLLPLVGRQLAAAGLEEPLLPRLQGMRRRTWTVNQLRLDRLGPALGMVQASGAEPLVVQSFELPALYYGDLGVRAVNSLHLLVGEDGFDGAARGLGDAGWTAGHRGRSWTTFGAEGEECVLHRRLFDEFAAAEPAAPVDFELHGVAAKALAPVDELLDVCLRGARMGRWRSHVWLADAHTILRTAGAELDWAELVGRAARLRATLRLLDALRFLRSELGAPVPDGVLEELERVRVGRREALAHRLAATRPAPERAIRLLRVGR